MTATFAPAPSIEAGALSIHVNDDGTAEWLDDFGGTTYEAGTAYRVIVRAPGWVVDGYAFGSSSTEALDEALYQTGKNRMRVFGRPEAYLTADVLEGPFSFKSPDDSILDGFTAALQSA